MFLATRGYRAVAQAHRDRHPLAVGSGLPIRHDLRHPNHLVVERQSSISTTQNADLPIYETLANRFFRNRISGSCLASLSASSYDVRASWKRPARR